MPGPFNFFIPVGTSEPREVIPAVKNTICGIALSPDMPCPPVLLAQIKKESALSGENRVLVGNASAVQCVVADRTGQGLGQSAELAVLTNTHHVSILLADCMSQETPGTAYYRAQDETYEGLHHRSPMETTPYLAVLMLAQYVATTYRKDTHQLKIYHDDPDILAALYTFYQERPRLLPHTLSLSFYGVEPERLYPFRHVIVGTGEINEEYPALIRSMIWLAGLPDFDSREAIPLRNVDVSTLTEAQLLSPDVELNLFDVDGSLFNSEVDALLLQQPGCKQVDLAMLIKGNAPLVAHLARSAPAFTWRLAGNFSARQCELIDTASFEKEVRVPGQNEHTIIHVGSCFAVLQAFAQSQHLLFSLFSLTDCMNGLAMGTTYRRLLNTLQEPGPHPLCPLEKHKILLLLGHILYTYQVLPPTSGLTVNVFDDRLDILERLVDIFELYAVFPKDTHINFYHHTSKAVALHQSIVSRRAANALSLQSIPSFAATASSHVARFLEERHNPLVSADDVAYHCSQPICLTDDVLSTLLNPAELMRRRVLPAPDELPVVLPPVRSRRSKRPPTELELEGGQALRPSFK